MHGQDDLAVSLHGVGQEAIVITLFAEQYIKHDDSGPGIGKLVDQLGVQLSRPRPASQCSQAFFVNSHKLKVRGWRGWGAQCQGVVNP